MLIVATTFSWKFDAGEEDEPEDDVSPDCKIEVRQQMLCLRQCEFFVDKEVGDKHDRDIFSSFLEYIKYLMETEQKQIIKK